MPKIDFDPEQPFSKQLFGGGARPDPPSVVVRLTRELKPYDDGLEFERQRLAGWKELDALWREARERFGEIRLRPLIRKLSPAELEQLVARAKCRSERYRPARFFAYFQVVGARQTDFAGLAAFLRQHPAVVASAYVERVGPPPAVNLVGEPAAATAQFYLNARPIPAPLPGAPGRWALGGINAKAAWLANGGNGGDGAGVRIIDIERGWFAGHVDFVPRTPALLAGQNVRASASHGTAVLGILCAQDRGDNQGGIGVAPHVASIGCVSYVETIDPETCEPTLVNLADAITFATAQLAAGDVILIEATLYEREVDAEPPPPASPGPELMVPVEAHEANRDAIATATALGITVVEPGGNGTDHKNGLGYGDPSLDMDSWVHPADRALPPEQQRRPLLITDPAADCGAVMVSAACVTSYSPPFQFSWAPRGTRVDCYAHGQGVYTTNCAPPPPPPPGTPPPPACSTDGYQSRYAPPAFGGTSAAAAIVAGAVAAIQGLALAKLGAPFTPDQIRAMLRDQSVNAITGVTVNTPVVDVTRTRAVGVMPDLAGIMQSYLGL